MKNRKYKRNRKRNCATQTKLEQKQRGRTSSATNRWTVELRRGRSSSEGEVKGGRGAVAWSATGAEGSERQVHGTAWHENMVCYGTG